MACYSVLGHLPSLVSCDEEACLYIEKQILWWLIPTQACSPCYHSYLELVLNLA
jgi:hypothetical protein